MRLKHIDGGKDFDWGKASCYYAKHRDIYPPEFLNRLGAAANIAAERMVLDVGTGTGVIPRMLYSAGAQFTGVDASENQITEARRLAKENGMDINFVCSPAEDCAFSPNTFDSVTACQCFTYFNHDKLSVRLASVLKADGAFAVAYMGWLPFEDELAARSEKLILKYNPSWTGFGDVPSKIRVPDCYFKYFKIVSEEVFPLEVHFTRAGWHGRILSCRGVSVALDGDRLQSFSREHFKMLEECAPEEFTVRHFGAITALKKL